MSRPILAGIGSIIVIVLASQGPTALGATLILSEVSSDETSADLLDATFTFDVAGSALLFTAANDTASPEGYDLTAAYFNGRSHIDGLSLNPAVPGWTFHVDQRADGFGIFDYALIHDAGDAGTVIAPGESLTFTFEIVSTAPVVDTDFTAEHSTIPPGEHPSLAAVKFMSGPADDSAFGAIIPEPATLVLGLIGAGTMGRVRRRRRP